MEPKWDLKETWNGAFKGALKCKFEKQFPLVNLRGSFDKGPGRITDKGHGGITWGWGSLSGPFDKGTQTHPGESPGGATIAVPLEIEKEPYKQSLVRE